MSNSSIQLEHSRNEMAILAKENSTLSRQLTTAESESKIWKDSYNLALARASWSNRSLNQNLFNKIYQSLIIL